MRNENKKKLPKYGKLYYGHSSHISGNNRRHGKPSHFDGWLRMARNVLGIIPFSRQQIKTDALPTAFGRGGDVKPR